MKENGREAVPNLTAQQYAIRLLQMLEDFGEEYIRIDSVLVVVKMLAKQPVENAVFFATGDAYQFGACEFDDPQQARKFLSQLTDTVAYASILDGQFRVYRYPYRSRVIDEWVFVALEG